MDRDNILGDGAFGTVHRAYSASRELVAAKKINTSKLLFSKWTDIAGNELIPHRKGLSHPNIIKIYCSKDEPERGDLWVIMEYCLYTLDKYLNLPIDPPSADHIQSILFQVAIGIEYLHANELAHRDLKPDNIMIKNISDWPLIKVTDFSYARDLSEQDTSFMSTVRGNLRWLAPELLDERGHYRQHANYTRAVDIYCLGLISTFVSVDHNGRTYMRCKYCLYLSHGNGHNGDLLIMICID